MRYRAFGRTDLRVSEISFGGWAIGGRSFGEVDPEDAVRALARAEELGVNLVDTAAVYGTSEERIGRFLQGRRDRWVVATKYSGQPQGLIGLVEEQLRRLGTSWIDFYQLHWCPTERERHLYDELEALKESGKIRFAGVSLYTRADIERVLSETVVDGIQVAFGLLDPRPLIPCLARIRDRGLAVLARSSLKGGFLTGKYGPDAVFEGPFDQRSGWTARKVAETAVASERFRHLEADAGTMLNAAVSYPLCFPEVTSVLLSTKSEAQATMNFGLVPTPFDTSTLEGIRKTQSESGLWSDGPATRLGDALSRVKRLLWR